MKKIIFLLFPIFLLIFITSVRAESIVGETYVEIPFYPNQRAICRDALENIHIVWLYNTTTIAYASSSDDGKNWERYYFSYPSITQKKGTPHISCDGNNIIIAYASGVNAVIGISNNNGNSWNFQTPRTSCVKDFVLAERRGSRIYVIYQTDNTLSCGYSDITIFNSIDSGTTWGSDEVVLDGQSFYLGQILQMGIWFYSPSLSVEWVGNSDDKIHIAAGLEIYDVDEFYYYISYINSTSQYFTNLLYQPSKIFSPSMVSNMSNIYVSYQSKNRIYINQSFDFGINWTGERIDSIIDTSIAMYPSIALNKENLPVIVWQQNDTTNNKGWNLIMKIFDGTSWIPEEGYWITDDTNIDNKYPNLNFRSDDFAELVWKKGNNITYSKILEFFELVRLPPAIGEFTIISPIIKPEIRLLGDRKYLNIFWKAEYIEKWKKEIAIKCFLNCFNVGDDIETNCAGYQNCTSTTIASSQGVCTIQEPQYDFKNQNLVICKLYDPSIPNIEYEPYPNISFWPLNFSISQIKNISTTVGNSLIIPITIRNIGLLDDNYTINITPLSNQNFVFIKNSLINLSVKSNDINLGNLNVIPLYSTPINLGVWVYSNSPEWYECNCEGFVCVGPGVKYCPNGFSCELNAGKCAKYLLLKIESNNSSLEELNLKEVIFLILIVSVLVYRKGL